MLHCLFSVTLGALKAIENIAGAQMKMKVKSHVCSSFETSTRAKLTKVKRIVRLKNFMNCITRCDNGDRIYIG